MRLIDVEELKDDIAVLLERNEKLIDPRLAYAIDDTIDEQTVIEAEPVRRGRWLEEPGEFVCSVCYDAWAPDDEEMIKAFNYCPNCGAVMEGEE